MPKGVPRPVTRLFPAEKIDCLVVIVWMMLSFLAPGKGQSQAVTFLGSQETMPISGGLNRPWGVAVDAVGNAYTADQSGRVIELSLEGAQTTLASLQGKLTGIAVDGYGNVFVSDFDTDSVLKIPAGGGSPVPVVVNLNQPYGLAVNGANNLYIADSQNHRVLQLPAGGKNAVPVGPGYTTPMGVAVDSSGNVYIADMGSNAIFKVLSSDGSQVKAASITSPVSVAVDAANNLFIAKLNTNSIAKISSPSGSQSEVPGLSQLDWPQGIFVTPSGTLYVADSYNDRVVKLSPQSMNFGAVLVGGSRTVTFSFLFNSSVTLGPIEAVTQGTVIWPRLVAPVWRANRIAPAIPALSI